MIYGHDIKGPLIIIKPYTSTFLYGRDHFFAPFMATPKE